MSISLSSLFSTRTRTRSTTTHGSRIMSYLHYRSLTYSTDFELDDGDGEGDSTDTEVGTALSEVENQILPDSDDVGCSSPGQSDVWEEGDEVDSSLMAVAGPSSPITTSFDDGPAGRGWMSRFPLDRKGKGVDGGEYGGIGVKRSWGGSGSETEGDDEASPSRPKKRIPVRVSLSIHFPHDYLSSLDSHRGRYYLDNPILTC
jgi:hypothetical protein